MLRDQMIERIDVADATKIIAACARINWAETEKHTETQASDDCRWIFFTYIFRNFLSIATDSGAPAVACDVGGSYSLAVTFQGEKNVEKTVQT